MQRVTSRPVRARGLKPSPPLKDRYDQNVAPRAGAWIETHPCRRSHPWAVSRPVRARGLKQTVKRSVNTHVRSRPVRARGLKQRGSAMGLFVIMSRPVRARGLKPSDVLRRPDDFFGRAPCGRVD